MKNCAGICVCPICGLNSYEFELNWVRHHIQYFPKEITIWICKHCHYSIHGKKMFPSLLPKKYDILKFYRGENFVNAIKDEKRKIRNKRKRLNKGKIKNAPLGSKKSRFLGCKICGLSFT